MKEIKEAIRNNKKVILIGTLVLLLVLLGTTFAYLTKTLNGNKEYIVRAGSLNLVLTEPNDLTFEKIIPIEDEEGLALDGFEFSVENKGSAVTDYTVYLDDVELSNGETRMPDAYIRYSLDVDGVKGSPKDLQSMGSNPERVVTTGTLKQNGKKNYVLRIWIEYNTTREQASGKTFKGKLRVVASPAPKPNMMKAFRFNTSNYKNVVKVVTQDTLTEPSNVTYSEDLSEAGDGSIMAYVDSNNVLTIAEEGGVFAGQYIKFSSMSAVTDIDLTHLDTSNVTDMSYMFSACANLTNLNFGDFDTSSVTSMSSMFTGCSKLTSIDLSKFDTSNATSLSYMFNGCKSLTSLDLSKFDTSMVTTMASMFAGCKSLTSLDLSKFDTSKVTNMNNMFNNCSSLTSLNLVAFNTSNLTDASYMFFACSSLSSLNLTGFDTSKVTNMNSMFNNCSGLTSLNLTSFNTSKVTNMNSMFSGCSSLTSLDVSNFDTSNVTKMSDMFGNCRSLTSLNLTSFDTSKVTNMRVMFFGDSKITAIYVSSKWIIASGCNTDSMFSLCGVSSVTVV